MNKKIQVVPIPGSIINYFNTLSVFRGFRLRTFLFYGFLPKTENELKKFNKII